MLGCDVPSAVNSSEVLASLTCPRLRELDIKNIPMVLARGGPAELHMRGILDSLPGLTRLWLDTDIMGDLPAQLGHLTSLPNLQDVFIHHKQLDFPAGIFPAMAQLTRLGLSAQEPPPQAIQRLGFLTNLQALELIMTPALDQICNPEGKPVFLFQGPEDTAGIASLTQLTHIQLTCVHGRTLAWLPGITSLRRLCLRSFYRFDPSLVAGLTWLQHLTLDATVWNRAQFRQRCFPQPYPGGNQFLGCPTTTRVGVLSCLQQQQHLTPLYMSSLPWDLEPRLGTPEYAALTASSKLEELVIGVESLWRCRAAEHAFPAGCTLTALTKLGFLQNASPAGDRTFSNASSTCAHPFRS